MKNTRILLIIISLVVIPLVSLGNVSADSANPTCNGGTLSPKPDTSPQYCCGGGSQLVKTSIDFGCQGKGNPIMDMLFAFIKLLSDGVGLVVIASMIVAGIQYTSSRGDPQATAKAIGRIQSNVTALFLFIFAYAILNYLIPGQFLK